MKSLPYRRHGSIRRPFPILQNSTWQHLFLPTNWAAKCSISLCGASQLPSSFCRTWAIKSSFMIKSSQKTNNLLIYSFALYQTFPAISEPVLHICTSIYLMQSEVHYYGIQILIYQTFIFNNGRTDPESLILTINPSISAGMGVTLYRP